MKVPNIVLLFSSRLVVLTTFLVAYLNYIHQISGSTSIFYSKTFFDETMELIRKLKLCEEFVMFLLQEKHNIKLFDAG